MTTDNGKENHMHTGDKSSDRIDEATHAFAFSERASQGAPQAELFTQHEVRPGQPQTAAAAILLRLVLQANAKEFVSLSTQPSIFGVLP
jgi:hypothetical protein